MRDEGGMTAARSRGAGLFAEGAHRQRRASGFDSLPEPLFLIDGEGRLLEANEAAARLLAALPAEGSDGALGRAELAELFRRAAVHSLAPSPLRVDSPEGARHYEARFSPAGPGGLKAVLLADITVWKRLLAEKESLLARGRAERGRLVPVCARCGALRDESGAWSGPGALERAGLEPERLTHGLCPACLAKDVARAEPRA